MITLTKSGNAIVFTFDDNDHYLNDGKIEVPVNSLTLVTDDSQMATFRKAASNDIFISATYDELGMSKADLESWFKENACGSTGGSVTPEEVQDMIDESISGKADTSDVQEIASDVTTVSGDVNTLSGSVNALTGAVNTLSGDVSTLSGSVDSNHNAITALNGDVQTLSGQVQGDEAILTGHTANTDIHVTASDKQNWNNKSDFSGSYNDLTDKPTIPVVPTNVSVFNNDAGYATSGYVDSSVSGKMDTSTFNTYSASTDARLSEDEEVTAAALNSLNNNKQDKLTAGENITINGNVISAAGGNNVIELTQAQYDALTDIDPDAFYIITDADGGATTGQVQTMINNSISGKADTSAVTEAVSGKMDTSSFNTYSANTDARISEDEEVTAAGLNALNDALSGKQDTLSAGTNITISGNVISAEGGGKAISAGTGISVTTGATADTINCTLPISGNVIDGVAFVIESYYTPNTATGRGFAHGVGCNAINTSHAEGSYCVSKGNYSHAEGESTSAGTNYNSGAASHSEGNNTFAKGYASHAEGIYTITENISEHSQGQYNVSNKANTTWGDSGNTLFSVGNGTSNNARHNAFEIRQNGDIYLNDGTNDVRLQDTILALGGLKLVQISQSDYDLLPTKDPNTLYIITNVVS